MKKTIFGIMASTALLLSNPINDKEAYININSSTLGVGFESQSLQLFQNKGFRYNLDYLNNDDFDLIQASIKNVNKIETVQGSELGVGIKAIFIKNSFGQYTVLPLTTSFEYNFPALMFNIPPVSIDVDLAYAPKVLSFNNEVDRFLSYSLELNIEPINGVKLYTGYRSINLKNIDSKANLNSDFYGGIKMSF